MNDVVIHYARPLHGTTVFRQRFVDREGDCTITFMEHAELKDPVRAGDRLILEPGAPVVWFTFDGAWHDIGRFHTCDGRFTGFYANILTPVRRRPAAAGRVWETTDLCLDVWLGADGSTALLDEEDLRDAVAAGVLAPATAEPPHAEARRLLDLVSAGAWPPPVATRWTLDRVRGAIGGGHGDGTRHGRAV